MQTHLIKLLTSLSTLTVLASGCGLYAEPQKPAPVKHATDSARKTTDNAASKVKKTTSSTMKKATTTTTTTKNPAPKAKLKVIAFYDQTMSHVKPDPFTFVSAHPHIVTYLSPFWYEVTKTGSILAKPEGNAAALAAKAHLPVMPLFNNYMGNDGMLATPALRTAAVDNIVKLVTSKNYAGVQIDFQQLKPADRTTLVDFMKTLHAKMPASKSISMSVVPLTASTGQSGAYDMKALDPDVNSMVLMAYDLHSNGTPAGPVSPFPWVQKSIEASLKAGVSPSKLYLGIADYGYLWKNGSTVAKTIPLKVMYQHKYGAYTWDSKDKEAYDHYTSKGVSYTIWFVNDRGAVDRIKLAEKDHLGGVGIWRIGYEDAQWWNKVASAIDGKSAPTTGKTGATSGGANGTNTTKGSAVAKTGPSPGQNTKNGSPVNTTPSTSPQYRSNS